VVLRRDLTRLLLGVCLLGLALPLASYALTGWFSRYASDDFCTAGAVVEQGYFGAQAYWYTAWSGRFAFFALVSALELGGVRVAQVLPGLALLGGVAALSWMLVPLAWQAGWRHARLASVVLAELIVFGACASVPNLGQWLFWQTGVLTYALPLILLVVFVGWLIRVALGWARVGPLALLGSGVLLCLAGGLSETTLALQIVALGLATLAALAIGRAGHSRTAVLPLLGAGLLGSLVAAAILGLAPGNAERVVRSDYPGAQLVNLPLATSASLRLLFGFARRFEAEVRPVLVTCGLLSLAIGALVSRSPLSWPVLRARLVRLSPWLVLGLLGAAVLVASSFFPSYWVLGFDPPARVEGVAQAILVGAVAGLGLAVGRLVGCAPLQPWLRLRVGAGLAVVALGLLLVPLASAGAEVKQLPAAASYATQWDRADGLLRSQSAAGVREVAVPALPQWWGWDWVGPRTSDFPNGCVARYYGVAAVRSESLTP